MVEFIHINIIYTTIDFFFCFLFDSRQLLGLLRLLIANWRAGLSPRHRKWEFDRWFVSNRSIFAHAESKTRQKRSRNQSLKIYKRYFAHGWNDGFDESIEKFFFPPLWNRNRNAEKASPYDHHRVYKKGLDFGAIEDQFKVIVPDASHRVRTFFIGRSKWPHLGFASSSFSGLVFYFIVYSLLVWEETHSPNAHNSDSCEYI